MTNKDKPWVDSVVMIRVTKTNEKLAADVIKETKEILEEMHKPIVTMAELKRHKQIIRDLRDALLAAKAWLSAADENHQEKLMREALRLKLKELGL